MKKFNFKKIAMMGLAAMMAVSAMSMTALADDVSDTITSESEGHVVVIKDAEIGTVYELGNGLKAKVIDDATYDALINDPIEPYAVRPTSSPWSLNLSGTSKSKTWTTTSSYPYWHSELNNTQNSWCCTTVKITSPKTYSTVTTTTHVYGGNIVLFYMDSQEEYEDHLGRFTMSLTSDATMSGTASGFITNYLPDAYTG